MGINIKKLTDHVEAIPKLSILLHELICKRWSPQDSLLEIKLWFEEWKSDRIPLAFAALEDENPVGMCSLQLNDGIRSDLKPWLGDLCVDPAYQNQGVGKLLIEACKRQAKEQGYNNLYLFAPDPEVQYYYQRLGWSKMGTDIYNGHTVTIMKFTLV